MTEPISATQRQVIDSIKAFLTKLENSIDKVCQPFWLAKHEEAKKMKDVKENSGNENTTTTSPR